MEAPSSISLPPSPLYGRTVVLLPPTLPSRSKTTISTSASPAICCAARERKKAEEEPEEPAPRMATRLSLWRAEEGGGGWTTAEGWVGWRTRWACGWGFQR